MSGRALAVAAGDFGNRFGSAVPTPAETARGLYAGARWAVGSGLPAISRWGAKAGGYGAQGVRGYWDIMRGAQQLAAGADLPSMTGRWSGADGSSITGKQAYPGRSAKWQSKLAANGGGPSYYNTYTAPKRFNRMGMGMPGAMEEGMGAFFKRGAMGHMAKVGTNMNFSARGLTGGLFEKGGARWMGLMAGAFLHGGAMLQSSDNIFSARDGYARHLSKGFGEFIGGDIGMGVGASIGTLLPLLGPLTPVIGMLAGGAVGFMAGAAVGDAPWQAAEWGAQQGKPFRTHYQDSQRAATMRQRSLQMISRSEMNARGALSQEASAYHL